MEMARSNPPFPSYVSNEPVGAGPSMEYKPTWATLSHRKRKHNPVTLATQAALMKLSNG